MTLNTLKKELKLQTVIAATCVLIVLTRQSNETLIQFFTSKMANLTLYFLINKAIEVLAHYMIDSRETKLTQDLVIETLKRYNVFFITTAVAWFFSQNATFEELTVFNLAYLVYKYVNMNTSLFSVTYGVGMATSFFEGYLTHILPNDGKGNGFLNKIETFENDHNVKFPVKRLFIICTESMYSPPDLKEFNHTNRPDLAQLENSQSLQEVEKDVAGVKGRIYRNTIYKIVRKDYSPVYIAAECATPLHTLHRAMGRAAINKDLCKADVSCIVREFTSTVRDIVQNTPETRGKCELIYFNDKDPTLNLADVLLDRIKQIEENFENII